MKLEDFLTLTEMRNGFTSPARVQELVSIIQNDRDCVINNVGKVARQWCAVASTIIATENKECLELFVQLDGLCFYESWLRDALRFGSETDDYFLKETTNHLIAYLLRAVEKLHVDVKKSVFSGIRETVKSLIGHKSPKVQERAKSLLDSWDKGKDEATVLVDTEKVQASVDDRTREAVNAIEENGRSEPSSGDKGGSGEEKGHVANNKIPCSQSDDIYQSSVGETSNSNQNLGDTHTKDAFPTSPFENPVTEGQKVEDPKDPTCRAEGAANTIDTCTFAVTRPGALDEPSAVPVYDSINNLNHIKEDSEKFNTTVSKPLEDTTVSSGTDNREALDAVTGSELRKQADAYNEDNCRGKSSCNDASVDVPIGNTLLVDNGRPANHGRSNRVHEANEDRKYNNDILEDSDKRNLEGHIDSLVGRADKHTSDRSEDDLENGSEFEEAEKGGKGSGVLGMKSDIDLDYGIIDPLELARQVAIEVEREVEQSCSSSEEIKESKVHEPDSPDSICAKQCQKVDCSNKEVSKVMARLTETSVANLEARPINGTEKVESSQVIDATLDLETNVDKGLCNFDLNLKGCSDDIDVPGNPVSTSISVVSASRAAAAPRVPVTPLQFEGTLGWKGFAATSAFRPASPRRIPENERAASSHGIDSSSKQLLGCNDIDLNASEGGDDRVAELFPVVQVSLLSALPLGESSAEVGPKKLERLELDLNCGNEEGEAPSDWRMEGRLASLRNGHQSQSPLSSASKLMNFDLNDQPSLFNDFSDLNNFKKSQDIDTSGGVKSGDSVVSIMGMKVKVNHNDFAAQSFPILNSSIAENAVDHNVARGGGFLGLGSPFQYTYPPPFGYNGITPGPPMAFSSPVYGPSAPIPYMMDSRGSPLGQQIVGTASAIPPSFPQQPFFVSMGGAPIPTVVGPSRSDLNRNTGLMLDGRSRDLGGLRQFLDQEQARPMDEHFRTGPQPSTSLSIGGKRKEPDGGWEPYPFKLHPPSWK